MAKEAAKHPLGQQVRQSPPIDIKYSPDEAWIKGKVIVITGGASGFGEGFVRKWAKAGASIIVGDINVAKGDKVIREIQKETGNSNLHFFHCNVTNWQSQVELFRQAVKLSPHGGIDVVVANAGTGNSKNVFEAPDDLNGPDPPPPDTTILDVNLTGVVYTSYLALWHLPRNPGSAPADPNCDPAQTQRDRHLILISSIAGLMPVPGAALYGASKHGVVGLYRSLRSSSFTHGVRVNMLCPYFIDTPLLDAKVRAIVAGGAVGSIEDVVEAATRFAADPRVVGRVLMVTGKMNVIKDDSGKFFLAEGEKTQDAEDKTLWEVYPCDFDDSDVFQRRVVAIMNRIVEVRGWTIWMADMFKAVSYGVTKWWSR
ncbi:MAG: hypothetical protein LQ342_003599 [Letrouitia transgressa]|nr:MAG: hypothetical protein LQ342_003599 [Letrouitia transgressa]